MNAKKRNTKSVIALLLALIMVLSLAACGNDSGSTPSDSASPSESTTPSESPSPSESETPSESAAPSEEPAAELAANAEKYVPTPGDGAKYTVEETADGWVKIVNEGGDTLGLATTSGVKIVEDDGFAFKDLNQNGELDPYEDWRLSDEERAADLVSQLKGSEKAAILAGGGWGSFTTEPLTVEDGSATYLMAGGRGGVTRNISRGGGDHAKWINQIQTVAESCYYGIPAMIYIDPANISGLIECQALGSTMDPELAAEIGQETAKQYRAAGVSVLLGPQVDLPSPMMSRTSGTYSEDPQLTRDIATAYVNGMQSTYDENGEDLGWGNESVYCTTKHFFGAGATEGGRDDHHVSATFAIFPGDNLEAHLISYFDGVFDLPGKTKSSGIMTEYSVNMGPDGECYGGYLSGAYNPYINGILDYAGYEQLVITDWGVTTFAGSWGKDPAEEVSNLADVWLAGGNIQGGYGTMENVHAAYDNMVEKVGEDEANAILDQADTNLIVTLMRMELFENPYNDSAYADSICYSDSAKAYGLETQRQSVVMLKNDGTISADGASSDKPTVYVPYVYNTGWSVGWMSGISQGDPSWKPSMDLDILGNYFNIVTDKLGDPTGEKNKDDKATYTVDDLTRASADEIAACDYILVGMSDPYTMSYDKNYQNAWQYAEFYKEGFDADDDVWYPTSLQYGEYTATTAPETSFSGLPREDGTQSNRSYKDQTAAAAPNYGDLEALQYAESVAGDIPVIVSMKQSHTMVWSEVEPLADVILVCYQSQKPEVVAEIILGQTEPNGLLVQQQPASMEAVEAQVTDVPRDMECYVDAAGNTYDFAFGMNWSGVISDARTEKYSAAPLTTVNNIDYAAYEAANK